MVEKVLYDLYYTHHNYDGINNLFEKAKLVDNTIKKNDVKEWLRKQATYQINFNKVESKKEYLPIYSEIPNSYQIDLTFLNQYKKQNNNYYVLFTAIGINTRYAYVDYSKDKNSKTILNMFEKFYKHFNNNINHITGDLGTEFTNKSFTKFLNDNKISYDFYKSDSHKLGIINRFHKTLKNKLTKYMTANDSVKWIDVIDEIVYNYNNTINRGINEKPINVIENPFLEKEIIKEKNELTNAIKKDEIIFNEKEKIRVRNNKKLFEDKMKPKYSYNTYTIKKVNKNNIIVEDDKGIQHTFKKYKVIKITDDIENIKNPINIKKDVKENKVIRILKKDDIISPTISKRLREKNTVKYAK